MSTFTRLIFMVPGCFSLFFMVPGCFSWFSMVPGGFSWFSWFQVGFPWFYWFQVGFSWFFPKMYPPKLYPCPMIQSKSAARRAAQDLVTLKGIGNNLFIYSIFWIPPNNWTTAISLTGVSILSAKSENSGSKISNLLIRR